MGIKQKPELTGIIYLSQALIDFDRQSIEQLLKVATTKNYQFNITGYLYYEDEHFFQYIEGETVQVNRLMENIQHDGRHSVLIDVHDDTLISRRFPGWNMRYIYKDQLREITMEKVFLKYLIHNSYRKPETNGNLPSGTW